MSRISFIVLIHVTLLTFMIGVVYSYGMILQLLSAVILIPTARARSLTVKMPLTFKMTTIYYLHMIASVGVFLTNTNRIEPNWLWKLWVASGVISFGMFLYCLAALLEGRWYKT